MNRKKKQKNLEITDLAPTLREKFNERLKKEWEEDDKKHKEDKRENKGKSQRKD